MKIELERYVDQRPLWPSSGRHVLACFDDAHIVVYQAYKPAIGLHAARHQRFGDGFSRTRMTWIKPNFLWTMYRSGWGTKRDQEITLALHLRRTFFDALLTEGVSSSVKGGEPNVRIQWDPDHDPKGVPQERRAIQIGVRGKALERMLGAIDRFEDVSDLVAAQRGRPIEELVTPRERIYCSPLSA